MKRFTSLFVLLALAFCIPKANAEVVENYLEKFSAIDVSKHDFAPTGWGHIVDYAEGSYETYYVEYTNPSEGGSDGAYLAAGSQSLGDYDFKTTYDLLVTPPLTGEASFYAKLQQSSGSIEIYTCTATSSGWEKGEKLDITIPELSTSEWTKVELPAQSGSVLGIRLENAAIDEFASAQADIVEKRTLTIGTVTPTVESVDYVDANANGTAEFGFKVQITNTGDADLNAGDSGYSINIVDYSDNNKIVGTTEITSPLAKGSSTEVTVTAQLPISAKMRHRYDIVENISGTSKFGSWIEFYPYTIDFYLTEKTTADDLAAGTTIDYGLIKTDVTKEFRLRNKGGAPAQLTSISVPDGFSFKVLDANNSEMTAPYVISPHAEIALQLTLHSTDVGSKEGSLVFNIEGADAISFPLKGEILDPSKLFVDFEDQKFPAGTLLENTSWQIYQVDIGESKYCAQNSLSGESHKFILPKVKIEEGQTLIFDAAKRGYSTTTIDVYYSPDRKTWTLLRTLSSEAQDEADLLSNELVSSGWGVSDYKYKTFTVDNIPVGEWYIAFGSGYGRVDNIYGPTKLDVPEKELAITSSSIPESGTVNYESEASITVANLGQQDIAENTLTAKLKIGETVVGEKAMPAIEIGTLSTISFKFTPRTAGNFEAVISVEGDGYNVSDTKSIAIEAESPIAYKAVGSPNTTSTNAPLTLNYHNSDSETIYTSDLINLPAGTKIYEIAYKGSKTSDEQTTHVTAWIENTSDGVYEEKPAEWHSTDGMTKIFDGDYTFKKAGSYDSPENMLVFDLKDNPFVYTGGNIRIMVSSRANSYKTASFAADETLTNNTIIRYKDNVEPSNSDIRMAYETAVVYFLVEKELKSVSGTVASSTDGQAIEGAAVKLVNGVVEYTGETDAQGAFKVDVYQDELEYAMTVTKEGFFTAKKSVSFANGSVVADIALNPAEGFNIDETNIPTSGMVNNPIVIKASVLTGVAKSAGSYSAELLVDGEVAATAEAVALEANSPKEFTFSYVPHSVGEKMISVRFYNDEFSASSDAQTINVAEESTDSFKQVGSTTGVSKDEGPAKFFNYASITELIYTKDKIGLPVGTKMLSIRFKGNYASRVMTSNVKAWIANTTSSTVSDLAPNKSVDKTGMTQIFDGVFECDGSTVGSSSNPVELFNFPIPDDFSYEGNNLRLVVEALSPDGTWASVYFEVDANETTKAQLLAADQRSFDDLYNASSWQPMSLPTMYVEVEPTRTVSGTITNEDGQAVEGAKVTLKSGDVEYYGSSDATGAYSVTVVQHSLDYHLSAEAEGYMPYTAANPVTFVGGNVTLNINLEKNIATYAGTVVDFNTNTMLLQGATVTLTDEAGVSHTTTTDASGAFSIADLKRTAYTVDVALAEYEPYSSAVDLTNGSITNAFIALVPKYYAIEGTITDATDETRLNGVVVSLKQDGKVVATATSVDGAFSFEKIGYVTKFDYSIELTKEGYESKSMDVDFSKADAERLVTIDVTMTPFSSVEALSNLAFEVHGSKGSIVVTTESDILVNIYNAAGRLVDSKQLQKGKTSIDGFSAGIYIVNGIKVAVR